MKKWNVLFVIFAVLVNLALTSTALARPAVCSRVDYSVEIRKGVKAHVALFETLVPEGAVIMTLGAKRSFENSQKFIGTFCSHGLSVVAFDLFGKKKNDHDYLLAGQKISQRLGVVRKNLPLIAYGFSRGAPIAAQLVKSPGFQRLILENPEMTTHLALTLSRLPKGETKVFACRGELSSHAQDFKYLKGATVLIPAHSVECGNHQLSSLAEAQDSMGDFIESDFAGVRASNWYWRRM